MSDKRERQSRQSKGGTIESGLKRVQLRQSQQKYVKQIEENRNNVLLRPSRNLKNIHSMLRSA